MFTLLKPYMEKPKVVKCPDGHFHCAIFSLGPYITDYPEQVWLSGVVSNWCSKYVLTSCFCTIWHISRCDALATNLDGPGSHCRSHKKTDFLIQTFDPGILWDEFGIWHDVVGIFLGCKSFANTVQLASRSHMGFHKQTSTNFLHLTFCTNSSKVSSRIIW